MAHCSSAPVGRWPITAFADSLQSAVGESLGLVLAYDSEGHRVLYAAERLRDDEARGDAASVDVAAVLPASHLAVLRRDGVPERPGPGAVGTHVTYREAATVLWISQGERGAFVVLDGTASMAAVQKTIGRTLGDAHPGLPLDR